MTAFQGYPVINWKLATGSLVVSRGSRLFADDQCSRSRTPTHDGPEQTAEYSLILLINRTCRLNLIDYYSFDVKYRAERTGRNPQTGQKITIAAARIPSFKPGKVLKGAVNS
jgi:Bacterial DNA-binding protein